MFLQNQDSIAIYFQKEKRSNHTVIVSNKTKHLRAKGGLHRCMRNEKPMSTTKYGALLTMKFVEPPSDTVVGEASADVIDEKCSDCASVIR